MTIAELNNCINIMRDVYMFDFDETEIRIGIPVDNYNGRTVELITKDKNGTYIKLNRMADEL